MMIPRVLVLALAAAALQVEEQIRILDPRENPAAPSQDFLTAMNRGRETLLIGPPDAALTAYFQTHRHRITVREDANELAANGAYNFDSVVVTDSANLTKANLNRLVKFYDTRWAPPQSYDDRHRTSMRGLKLPPSLLFFGASRHLLSEFGVTTAKPAEGEVLENPFRLPAEGDVWRNATVRPLFASPLSHPLISYEDGSWAGALVQGDVSWSRAAIIPSYTPQRCAKAECAALLDWVFHRSRVLTWANLQHWRVAEGREFDEYTGQGRSSAYTEAEFGEVKLEKKIMYKIRDELVVTVDVHELKRGTKGYEWHALSEPVDFYGSFEMMVPYWRKKLLVHGSDATAPTRLLAAVQAFGGERLGLKKGVSVMAHLKAPKQHGVYKFVVRAAGGLWAPVWLETLVPMRTYLHNEEEPRALWSAYPYYLSIGVMTAAPLYLLASGFGNRPKAV